MTELADLTAGQMRALLAASLDLNSTLELDEVLRRVTDTACEIARAERATMYVLDHDANEVWTRAMSGPRIETFRLPVGQGIVGRVAETGRTSHLKDAHRSAQFDRSFDASTGFRTRAMLTVAVRDRNRRVVGVLQVMNRRGGETFSDRERRAIEVLGDTAALALENSLAVQALREKRAIDEQLNAARTIQHVLLPSEISAPDGYSIAARYIPCQAVGGDCYDVFAIQNARTGLAVGDISGKGLTAAMMMTNLMALFRVEARRGDEPHRVLTSMNQLFHESTPAQYFATFFFGALEHRTGRIDFASAGHDPPLVIHADGRVEPETLGDTLLGIFPGVEFRPLTLELAPGDVCVVCSDGVTEQIDPDEEFFERSRLQEVVHSRRSEDAASIADAVLGAVTAFAAGTPAADDLTLLVVKRDPD